MKYSRVAASHPLGTSFCCGRPPVGRLTYLSHAVWRIETVQDLEPARWNEADEATHRAALERGTLQASWHRAPYTVELEHLAGPNPLQVDGRGIQRTLTRIDVHIASRLMSSRTWLLYPETGRWPQCSCCGEPMPCRTEMADRAALDAMDTFEEHASKMPGCCWSCTEPITIRQQAVTYAGINLDLPAGPEVRFHTRKRCLADATRYEARWLSEDPARLPILTPADTTQGR